MDIENVNEWVKALRSGDYEQTDGTLCRALDSTDPNTKVGYCCLGVAAVLAGDTATVYDDGDTEDEEGNVLVDWRAFMSDGTDLPGSRTHRWLGLEPREESDVNIDWPMSLVDRENRVYTLTCAHLNDSLSLTFPQIADVVAYFGLSDEPV